MEELLGSLLTMRSQSSLLYTRFAHIKYCLHYSYNLLCKVLHDSRLDRVHPALIPHGARAAVLGPGLRPDLGPHQPRPPRQASAGPGPEAGQDPRSGQGLSRGRQGAWGGHHDQWRGLQQCQAQPGGWRRSLLQLIMKKFCLYIFYTPILSHYSGCELKEPLMNMQINFFVLIHSLPRRLYITFV